MKKLYHGAAFYPELWDEKTIKEDIRLMKKTGINIVRVGEFIWSKLERNEGEVDISYLKYILDLLYRNDIEVIMCTPTPTPPIWFTHNHEERLHVDSKGRKMVHGSRQHVCTNNEKFRKASRNIVENIAKEVGKHPAIALWQLDNEFKCHISECFCETCKEEWHKWLEKRYVTIDNLNKKWGTLIWSELYQSFNQVPQPFESTPFIHNSSLSTMYRIFHREKIAEFASEQADIIRKYSKTTITTNAGLGFTTDNELLFENLDVAGYDTYASHETPHVFTLNCDIWRNIKKGKNYWLLETSTSHTGALDRHAEVHPNGYLASEAVATYALGGEGFIYWLWRQQPYGCEQSHSAVISAWGKPSVGYKNVLEVERARKRVEEFMINTEYTQAELAVAYSDMAKTFLLTESHKKDQYRGLITDFYNNVLKTGIHRDMIPEGFSLDGYKLLITPFMYYLSPEYFERAKKFVEEGGVWIVGPLTGGRTKEHTVNIDAALGKNLEELAGVETLYTYPMENSGATGEAFGEKAPLKLWSAVFKLNGAKAIGILKGGITDGEAFITENKVGKGKVIMLGSLPYGEDGDRMLQKMIDYYAKEVNIYVRAEVSEGTISIPRHDDENIYEVVVNMDGKGGNVLIPIEVFDVLEKVNIPKGELRLGRYEYKILKLNKNNRKSK
ncbi:beta-galactosidase [Clostridium sp. HBUAS56017]|uniref:beta-galactosidase n=1 Tax=Clostridium sp. HBUAS56017 TaxID=2571128 RepID=UPI0011789123|nr:beta-galactosidase [Clostridium sp. HBUAS56017]